MADLDATKWGSTIGPAGSGGDFATPRAANATSVSVNPTNSANRPIMYLRTGRVQHRFNRAFYYFDTSGITGEVSSVTLNILGGSNANDGDVIVIKSTAFGGDGSADLVTTDHSSTLDYNTAYSSEITSWTLGGNNALTLNSNAESDIQNNDAFIVAIINHDNDFQNSAAGSGLVHDNAINYGTTGFLSYTEAAAASGPANLTSYNGIAKASITSINGIAIANVTTLNGIS